MQVALTHFKNFFPLHVYISKIFLLYSTYLKLNLFPYNFEVLTIVKKCSSPESQIISIQELNSFINRIMFRTGHSLWAILYSADKIQERNIRNKCSVINSQSSENTSICAKIRKYISIDCL